MAFRFGEQEGEVIDYSADAYCGALLIAEFIACTTKDIHGRWKAARDQQSKPKRNGIGRYGRKR